MYRFLFILLLFSACQGTMQKQTENFKQEINQFLDQWHRDVAQYDFDAYFDKMAEGSVYVGTDANEVWTKKEFMEFAKPYFDKEQTWNFKPLDRNIYWYENRETVWFDEVLNTWMGICRGSGVISKTISGWKIEHYVLSVTIPNEDIKEVINIKKEKDSLFIIKHKTKNEKL